MLLHKAASLHTEHRAPTHVPSCEITAGMEGGAHVIHVAGELDLADCPRLDQALTFAEGTDAPLVLVDCDQLNFIDAAGLQSLFDASLRAAGNGDRLRITSGGSGVGKIFKLTGLDAVLPLTGRRNAA